MHAENTREWKICSVSMQRYVQSLLNAWQSIRRDATLTIQRSLNQGETFNYWKHDLCSRCENLIESL